MNVALAQAAKPSGRVHRFSVALVASAAVARIEAEIRGQPAAQRRFARQSQTWPLMDDFGIWLKTARSGISAKSRLGEKLSYVAKHMDGLRLFLEDGTVEMDSNAVERNVRPIALNRKKRDLLGARWRGSQLGPHRLAHRDLQA